jgi:branched-chain amino acid transport system ATP-binding protein
MLRLNGITKVFGGLTALEDVSFAVAEGSITGVIGPTVRERPRFLIL